MAALALKSFPVEPLRLAIQAHTLMILQQQQLVTPALAGRAHRVKALAYQFKQVFLCVAEPQCMQQPRLVCLRSGLAQAVALKTRVTARLAPLAPLSAHHRSCLIWYGLYCSILSAIQNPFLLFPDSLD